MVPPGIEKTPDQAARISQSVDFGHLSDILAFLRGGHFLTLFLLIFSFSVLSLFHFLHFLHFPIFVILLIFSLFTFLPFCVIRPYCNVIVKFFDQFRVGEITQGRIYLCVVVLPSFVFLRIFVCFILLLKLSGRIHRRGDI